MLHIPYPRETNISQKGTGVLYFHEIQINGGNII